MKTIRATEMGGRKLASLRQLVREAKKLVEEVQALSEEISKAIEKLEEENP